MPSTRFEPTITAIERLQTCALNRKSAGIGYFVIHSCYIEGCLTVHLSHEIMWNANLMQQGNFIDVFLARHVSGTYGPSSGALDVELQRMVFCTEFLDGWWS